MHHGWAPGCGEAVGTWGCREKFYIGLVLQVCIYIDTLLLIAFGKSARNVGQQLVEEWGASGVSS
jgi:hypothetical protein